MKSEKGIQVIISGALAAFAVYMGALAVPIIVLMVMMIIDYLSGMSAAWVHGYLSSDYSIPRKSPIRNKENGNPNHGTH